VGQTPGPRVLIVDDDFHLRSALRNLLTDYGIPIVGEAADGRQGVEAALALAPDIVLMDVRMPVLGGIDATRHLANMLPAARVIVCSAYADDTMREQAREAGAAAVIAKGDHPREFLDAIGQAWSQIQADRAWAATPLVRRPAYGRPA